MTNQLKGVIRRETRPMDTDMAQRRWEGYSDAAGGLGFRREYDTWPAHLQRNYEAGRQYAATARGIAGRIPKWPRNRKLSAVLGALGPVLTPHHQELIKLFMPRTS